MKTIWNKIFGYFKLIYVLYLIYILVITLINQYYNPTKGLYGLIGRSLGMLTICYYCFYIVYSGWSDLMVKRLNKTIIWIGSAISALLVIVMIFMFFRDGSDILIKLGLIGLIIITISLVARDIYRIQRSIKSRV